MNPITLFVCAENSDPKNSVAGTRATEGKLPTTRFPPGGHVFGLGLHELGPVEGRTVASIAERGGGNVRTTLCQFCFRLVDCAGISYCVGWCNLR